MKSRWSPAVSQQQRAETRTDHCWLSPYQSKDRHSTLRALLNKQPTKKVYHSSVLKLPCKWHLRVKEIIWLYTIQSTALISAWVRRNLSWPFKETLHTEFNHKHMTITEKLVHHAWTLGSVCSHIYLLLGHSEAHLGPRGSNSVTHTLKLCETQNCSHSIRRGIVWQKKKSWNGKLDYIFFT